MNDPPKKINTKTLSTSTKKEPYKITYHYYNTRSLTIE